MTANSSELNKYPKIKFSDKLRDENWGSLKGQVFLFIVVANEIGLAADYAGMETDYGAREKIQYFNDKLDSIINKKTGYYWEDDFHGFDAIFEKAKIAKPFLAIEKPTFTKEVAAFLDEVFKSHVPVTSDLTIKEEEPVTIPNTDEPPTVASVGETGEQLKKKIQKEKEAREQGDGNLHLSSFLEDEVDTPDEEEEEEESSGKKDNLELKSFLE